MPRITVEGELGKTVKIQLNGLTKSACILPGTTFERPYFTHGGKIVIESGIQPSASAFPYKIADEIKAGPVRLRGDVKYGLFVNVTRGPLKIRIPVPIQAVFNSLDTQPKSVPWIKTSIRTI